MTTEVSYTRQGPAGWITLNRPAKRNALTPAMLTGLHRALDRAEADPGVRVLVLTGAPPAFCAGADLEFFRAMLDEPDGCDHFLAAVIHPLAGFMARLRASARPVIAAVNGGCAAGGLAATLSQRSPVSIAAMKAMVHQAQQPSWQQTLDSDLTFFRRNWNSPTMREALTRPPRSEP